MVYTPRSKMECLSFWFFARKICTKAPPRQLQDALKTPQDSPRTPPGPSQDAPRRPQDALKSTRSGPRASPEAFKKCLGSVWEASCSQEALKSCPEPHQTLILKDFDKIFGGFWIDFRIEAFHFGSRFLNGFSLILPSNIDLQL